MMKYICSALLILFSIKNSFSQINIGGIPVGFKEQLSFDIPVENMPAFDLQTLQQEDFYNDKSKDIPTRFGFNHAVNFSLTNSGVWKTLQNGNRIWQLRIASKGAVSINLAFKDFHLPDGATLFIYNNTQTDWLGAFTSTNNQANNYFATDLVKGEEVTVEYFEPSAAKDQGSFTIYQVTHGYRDGLKQLTKSFGGSGGCNNNINCPIGANWQNEKRAVALILKGGNYWCSGSLLNDVHQDTIPYLITANHCASTNDTAGHILNNWVFRFNYESPDCSNTDGPKTDDMNGATVMSKNPHSDFCLLRLNQKIPPAYRPFFAGWDRTNNIPDSVVCIHHPSGDIKKITVANNACTDSSFLNATCWKVGQWTSGVTESGSSGSPLYNKHHHFVGQLYGGPSACGLGDSDLHDYFGKFHDSWNFDTSYKKQAAFYLDPDTTNAFTINSFDPFLNYTPPAKVDTVYPNADSPNFVLYPNPTRDVLNVEYVLTADVVHLSITDVLGRELKTTASTTRQANRFHCQIDLKTISSGIYFLKNNNVVVKKFMVE